MHLFGTSPIQASSNPIQITRSTIDGETTLHLIFPRRVGLAPPSYGYETSADLQQWDPAQGVTETILSSQNVGGVQIDTIDAAIPFPGATIDFARLRWLGP